MVRTAAWFYTLLAASSGFAAIAPVEISPTTASVRSAAQKQFTATLNGVSGPVTWSVNGVSEGNPTVGTVTTAGLFTAPVLNPGTPIKVRATAGTAFAEATVTWLNPAPSITSFTPAAVNVGTFTVTVNGKGFVAGSTIELDGSAVATAFVSSTALKFTHTITTAGTTSVTVANPDPGASKSGARTLTIMPPPAVTVSPATTSVRLGASRKFSASVTDAVDRTVSWSMQGSPAAGTIASDGTYTAPLVMPPTATVTVRATTTATPHATAQATITLLNPLPVIQSITPNPLTFGSQNITVTGAGFVSGSVVKLDGTAVPTQFVSPTQLTAMVTVNPTPGGLLAFRLTNPDPGGSTSPVSIVATGVANPKVSYLAAARFLEQASWGPDAASIAHVQSIGFDAWLTEQLGLPASSYKASTDSSNNLATQQAEFFDIAMRNPDQLRQRVAFALSQIFVVSGLKTGEPRQMVPYQNMLLNDAFGTYANLLRDVTLSPTMGVYLDMVNNDKGDPVAGTAPNENYGREVMQLFTIGTVMLNPDGSTKTDGSGNPILTYNQPTITGMAHALTGWTFPGKAITKGHNPENYNGPMIAVEANHDESAKTIVGGQTISGTAQQDLDAVLNALATHPNTAPFISFRLIQHLVTSNPSPAYIARISSAFLQSGGNLFQVVRAILLDPEARQGDNSNSVQVTGGHLREPVLFVLAMMKPLQSTVVTQNPIESLASDMGQNLFYSPSVFNYFSPLYHSGPLFAPEFQILTSATALVRANVVQNLVARGLDGDVRFNLTPLTALASDPDALVQAVDNAFTYGRLPASLRSDISTAIQVATSSGDRVRNAIYLVCSSALYQVEH